MSQTQRKPDSCFEPTCTRLLLLLSLACGGSPDGVLFADRAGPLPGTSTRAATPASSAATPEDELVMPLQPTSATPTTPGGAVAPGQSVPPGQSSVIWSAPADGEGGVKDDREVSLQFSEAMNIASVESALRTTLPGSLTLSWEGGGSLLRMKASERLEYAQGLTASALEFQVSIDSGAHSLSGVPLAPSTLTFRTLRRIQLLLEPSDDRELTGVALSAPAAPADAGAAAPCLDPDSLCAGDLPSGSGDSIQVKSFLSFDLSPLPRSAQLESARLRLVLDEVVGNPFGSRGLGSLHAERSWFSQIDPDAFRADPDATLAVFSSGATEAESGDITWVIQEARERGVTQYRLTFPQTTNRDDASDLAVFLPRRQRLELSYLIP